MPGGSLRVSALTKRFGGLVALDKVDVYVDEEEIVGLIGPNGSGKTTLFNCITHMIEPDEGRVLLGEQDITSLPTHKIIQSGISRTFQIVRNFPEMTVLDNLLCSQPHKGENILKSFFTSSALGIKQKAKELAAFVGLENLLNEPAGELSYGQQKLLDLVSALLPDPSIVLLDEPTAGVNPTLINEIMSKIKDLNREFGVAFFIIEHNIDALLSVATRMYALASGRIISEGSPQCVRNDPKVLDSYFGEVK